MIKYRAGLIRMLIVEVIESFKHYLFSFRVRYWEAVSDLNDSLYIHTQQCSNYSVLTLISSNEVV